MSSSLPMASAPRPQRFATVAEAQQAAIHLYPALGVPGSDFNKRFLALYQRYQKERPDMFRDTGWPVVIAGEVSQALR